jgi:hypothetical protein
MEGPSLPRARLKSPSLAVATTLPETVLLHTTEGPDGFTSRSRPRFQPAIFIFASAPPKTVAAELALVNS